MPEIIPPAPGQPSAEEYETTPPPQAAAPPAGLSPADSAVSSESRPEPAENELYVSPAPDYPPVPNENAGFLTDTAPGTEPEAAAALAVRSKFDYPDIPFNGEWPTGIIGVLDDTYLLASGKTGLILIDQHAAHERIMFERLLDAARHGAASQALLLPQTLELPQTMASLLLRNRKIFEAVGFDVEPLGSNTVMLNAVPAALPSSRELTVMIPDMLQELLDNLEHKLPVELEYVARAACRAAVKAHDALPRQAAEELLRQLGECRQGTLCPHGRPTMITITLREIEKRFARR